MLAVLPVALAVYMVVMGVSAFMSFHPRDSGRYLFGFPPVAIAALIVGTLVSIPRKLCRGAILVLDSGVEYNPGDHDLNVHFPWNDLVFSAPKGKQQMVRSLILAHRDRKMVFYDIFVPDFELLVAAIARRKTRLQSSATDGSLKIDSGRIGHVGPGMGGR